MELFLSLPKIMFNVIWSKARKSPPVLLGILVGGHCFLSFPSQLLGLPGSFCWLIPSTLGLLWWWSITQPKYHRRSHVVSPFAFCVIPSLQEEESLLWPSESAATILTTISNLLEPSTRFLDTFFRIIARPQTECIRMLYNWAVHRTRTRSHEIHPKQDQSGTHGSTAMVLNLGLNYLSHNPSIISILTAESCRITRKQSILVTIHITVIQWIKYHIFLYLLKDSS